MYADESLCAIVRQFCMNGAVCQEVFLMLIGNVRVVIENGPLSAERASFYIEKIQKSLKNHILKRVTFTLLEGSMDLRCRFVGLPFECIQRVPLSSPDESKAIVS